MLKHKILRQPVRYAVGVLIILLAVSIFCVTVSQCLYAIVIRKETNDKFTTIALPVVEYQLGDDSKYQEITAYLEELARTNPGIIREFASIGLASAHMPELIPLNQTNFVRGGITALNGIYDAHSAPAGAPYCATMLEMTLVEIGQPKETEQGFTVRLTGIVDSVVKQQKDYSDPTDFRLHVDISYSEEADLGALDLAVGERYLVYSPSYIDLDYGIREWMAIDLGIELPKELNPECFHLRYTSLIYNDGEIYFVMPWWNERSVQTARMSITLGEDTSWLEDPTLVHLEGSVEDFLASEEATEWNEVMERMEINYHAFPIIGVDRLEHVAEFARGNAHIVEGRNFTLEELETGAKVCIISYDLAQANGIQLGDTLSTSFYSHVDNVPYQGYLSEGVGLVKPAAYFYTAATEMSEAQGYTVIGFYAQINEPWKFDPVNGFAFTPNVIFAPFNSVSLPMEQPGQGMFYAVELENGTMFEFEELAIEAGLESLFACYDGGFYLVEESIEMFQQTANRAVLVGVAVYGILLLLYLLLFPAQEKKTLRTMNSLGAPRKTRFAYLLTTVLGTLLPGTLLGMGLGAALWGFVAQKLLDRSGAAFTVELNVPQFVLVGIAQILFALLLSVALALYMTKHSDLMRRK